MADRQALDELAERFAALGAPNPRAWASSQLEEGIPQLARFVFLREAWRRVTAEQDTSWIDDAIAQYQREPDAPFAGAGRALKRLRALGADDRDLTDLVRAREAGLLAQVCYLLADPSVVDDPAVEDVQWALVQVSEDGEVLGEISALHESVLETDPSGREMRPPTGRLTCVAADGT